MVSYLPFIFIIKTIQMTFGNFLKETLTKKEYNRLIKELDPIMMSNFSLDFKSQSLITMMLFFETRKGSAYWFRLHEICEEKKDKLISKLNDGSTTT